MFVEIFDYAFGLYDAFLERDLADAVVVELCRPADPTVSTRAGWEHVLVDNRTSRLHF